MPSDKEVETCSRWMMAEIRMVQPQLIILIGKLAINQFLPIRKLDEVVGQIHRIEIEGRVTDLAPLPHPSGLSTWPRMEPGKTLLQEALQAIEEHPAWQEMLNAA